MSGLDIERGMGEKGPQGMARRGLTSPQPQHPEGHQSTQGLPESEGPVWTLTPPSSALKQLVASRGGGWDSTAGSWEVAASRCGDPGQAESRESAWECKVDRLSPCPAGPGKNNPVALCAGSQSRGITCHVDCGTCCVMGDMLHVI